MNPNYLKILGFVIFNLSYMNNMALKEGACILFFRPRTRPKISLQCFALYFLCSKAKHCRNVLGRVLRRKNKIQKLSFRFITGVTKPPDYEVNTFFLCLFISVYIDIFPWSRWNSVTSYLDNYCLSDLRWCKVSKQEEPKTPCGRKYNLSNWG